MNRRVWIAIAGGAVATGVVLWIAARGDGCGAALDRWGLDVPVCPVGTPRQTVALNAESLRRGAEGTVRLVARAHYTTAASDAVESASVPAFQSIALALVDAKGTVTPLPSSKWRADWDGTSATVTLPEVPDGAYRLRATYQTRLERGEVEVALPLFTPGRIHVITDRPLYEPGNTVRFRAVVLRARDLAPLDGRPGTWVVTDPSGETMLEEQADAGAWGVVAGSFPLDAQAAQGTWTVQWRSGDDTDTLPFTVEPFTLPRFRVEATAERAYYRAGDKPLLRGSVRYSSGAPVAGARVEVDWRIDGEWPAPPSWLAGALPKQVVATAAGRFELPLPEVPADLRGRVTLTARIGALDAAGDRVEGAASVLLSEEGLQVSAVTELGDGLVQGFNNRLFVRATTPDGRVLANTKVKITRAWQPTDPGTEALLDEDGVASLQLDPGAPANIVIPAMPYRPAPKQRVVSRGEPQELVRGEGASLADQLAMDRWLPALEPCAKWHGASEDDDGSVTIGIRVAASGAITAVSAAPSQLDRCVAAVVRTRRLPAGPERLYAVPFVLADPALPSVEVSVADVRYTPEGFSEQLQSLASGARDCIPMTAAAEGTLARQLAWSVKAGAKTVTLDGWIGNPGGTAAAPVACIMQRLAGARIELAEPAAADSMGLATFDIALPDSGESARPMAMSMLGYELIVTQVDAPAASAKLRVAPGVVPDLRMRVTPILARAGETVTAQLIRGPEFRGTLPKELELICLKSKGKAPLAKDNSAQLLVPAGTEGWCEVTGGGERALVYVKPAADLAVSIAPKQERYAPGEQAELQIRTAIAGKGAPAAVGLFGVDDSLGQLAPLPGADAMARVQPVVTTGAPAFGALDGQALALGRIRGANAAAATVLRVTAIPPPPKLDAAVSARAETRFDPVAELTDNFYRVLAELHAQTRAWEAQAPASEQMTPATMARLWTTALAATERRGAPVVDAYGRRLRLALLPDDLLALTDPRYVVVVGTRLPEDMDNWTLWVRKEKP